jgi:hypothetical protein
MCNEQHGQSAVIALQNKHMMISIKQDTGGEMTDRKSNADQFRCWPVSSTATKHRRNMCSELIARSTPGTGAL